MFYIQKALVSSGAGAHSNGNVIAQVQNELIDTFGILMLGKCFEENIVIQFVCCSIIVSTNLHSTNSISMTTCCTINCKISCSNRTRKPSSGTFKL